MMIVSQYISMMNILYLMSFTELLIQPLHSANESYCLTSDNSKTMGGYRLQPKSLSDKKTVQDQ